MTTPATASRRSQRIRGILVAMVVLATVAAILASCKGHAALSPAAAPSEAPVASEAAATATPPGSTLLSLSGTGPMTSDAFHSSGSSVDVTYDYTCTQDSTFTVNFYGTNGSPVLPDIIADEYGTTGSASTVENLNGVTGPFTVEVVSDCQWNVKVTGTP